MDQWNTCNAYSSEKIGELAPGGFDFHLCVKIGDGVQSKRGE